MNLSGFRNSSEVIFQILFLWLINFDSIFGCLSVEFKPKEALIPENQKPLNPSELPNPLSNWPTPNEKELIRKFKEFISNKYKSRIKIHELEILWIQMKEFTRIIRKKSEPKHDIDFNRTHFIKIEDILSYPYNQSRGKIVGALNIQTGSKRISKDKKKYFDQTEEDSAMFAAQSFHTYACNFVNKSFCVENYFKADQSFSDFHQSVPPAILLKRCPKKCTCLQPNEDCLPTSIQSRTDYILTLNVNGEPSTSLFKLDDHTGCKCRDRCKNRKCIEPFQLEVYRDGVCNCVCTPGLEKKCLKIFDGYKNFTKSEYKCIINGTCINPICRTGELSEEDLYRRRCPRVLY